MSWQAASFALLAVVLVGGFAWYERSRPPARLVALVAALAALAVAGRVALAPIPNVVATTDIVLFTGYALGPAPGFAVGALAAAVSNIWLGQGPWTPWQMGAWGLVGLAGAAVAALTGRRLGRIGLAAACGAAGLAYGALLDLSVMVTYGGEQSLDRYLALSARGVPFNLAHAAGNVAIALAAGPALVRMISRFRERLEVRWLERPVAASMLAALVVAAGALGAPAPAEAGAADARSWLKATQNADGGFGVSPGAGSSPKMTGWAMLGLEAAGRNPLDVRRGGRSPVRYLRSRVSSLTDSSSASDTGDIELAILALEGAELDPRAFGGRNLVAELSERRSADGSFGGQVNLTAFAVLALRAADAPRSSIARSIAWLEDAQNRDGGWGSNPRAASDPDSTGAVLQALATGGGGDSSTARAGTSYLRRTQKPEGGWGIGETGPTNSQSTAWAIQGIVAVGGAPGSFRARGGTPLEYLAARQAGDGHYRYSSSSDQSSVWVTSQALLGATSTAFPLGPVRRAPHERARHAGDDTGTSAPVGEAGAPAGGSDTPTRHASAKARADRKRGGDRDGRRRAEVADQGRNGGRETERSVATRALAAEETTTDEGPGTAVWVAGGLGLLAAILLAGFLWYRRTLPDAER